MGSTGAGVPRPCNAKRANESSNAGAPAAINATPSHRVQAIPSSGGSNFQPEIHQGTSPATVPGASRRNNTVPTTEPARRMTTED